MPMSPFIKSLIKCYQRYSNLDQTLPLIAKQPYEKIQMRHIKYMLGVNRRSSNAAAWGETGKYPLFIKCIGQCINYFVRISNLPNDHLVKAALSEQTRLNLSWYSNIKDLIDCFDDVSPAQYQVNSSSILNALFLANLCSSKTIVENLQNIFVDSWKRNISSSSKLEFYSSVKSEFHWEQYLTKVSSFTDRRSTTWIRTSSHKLNIEVGRYNNIDRQQRTCEFCLETKNLSCIEDENHILLHCPNGASIRKKFISKIASLDPDHSFGDFNIAQTRPANLIVDDNSSNINDKIIRQSCNTIQRLYSNVLKYKKELADRNKAVDD